MTTEQQWWRDAVIYQVYPRSFADSDGDGMGDLPGITARLPHLAELGVDAVWLSPFYTSPAERRRLRRRRLPRRRPALRHPRRRRRADRAGPRARPAGDRRPGAQPLLERAPVVPGGARRRRRAAPSGRATSSATAGRDGELPPNNWRSVFGGPAWTRVTEADGTPGPVVPAPLRRHPARLRLDQPRGRRRVGVGAAVLARPRRRRLPGRRRARAGQGRRPARRAEVAYDTSAERTADLPMWDQPGVHDIYRRWRKVTDSYASTAGRRPHPRAPRRGCSPPSAGAVRPRRRAAPVVQLRVPDDAVDRRGSCATEITASLAAVAAVGAPQTWVLSNHDVVRHASRLGLRPGARPAADAAASARTTRSPTRRSACAGPGPRRP